MQIDESSGRCELLIISIEQSSEVFDTVQVLDPFHTARNIMKSARCSGIEGNGGRIMRLYNHIPSFRVKKSLLTRSILTEAS